ncbi:MAG: C40 family peptidase [Aquificaceae bacterium]|nr:C40 family peptidase [Aquificaceae bacterium]MDW8097275.1 C40 family peptidase [Aquificaceae bacterium]
MRGSALGLLLSFGLALSSPEGIALTALTYMDRSYQFGANDLYKMDCSAFVQRVFGAHGIRLPRSTAEQAEVGVPVSLSQLRPGDLLFYNTYRKGPSHVGIYVGNGRMVHASERKGIVLSSIHEPYWRSRFLFARRVLGGALTASAEQQKKKSPAGAHGRDEIGDLILILGR